MLATSWKTMTDNASGFSQVLKSGNPAAQEYAAALQKSVGTSAGLSVALQLTGEHAGPVNDAIKAIGKSTGDTAGNIKGWGEVQGNFNQQLDEAKASAGAMAIQVGQHLLPVLTGTFRWINQTGIPAIKGMASGVGDAVKWFSQLPGPVRDAALAFAAFKLAETVGWLDKLAGRGGALDVARLGIMYFGDSVRGSMGKVSGAFSEAKSASAFIQTLDGGSANRFTGTISGMGAAAKAAASGGLSMMKSAGSGLVSLFGGPWGVALVGATAGVTELMSVIKKHDDAIKADTDSVRKWQETLAFGSGAQLAAAGQHLDDLRAKIAATQAQIDAYNAAAAGGNARGGIGTLVSHLKELKSELNGGTDAWNKQRAAMTPVQEGQARVAMATDALNKALASHNPDQIANAYGALAAANTYLAGETNKDAQAQKSANQQLQDAATLAIGARDAALGLKLSQLDLNDAIKQVAQSQADGSLKGDALTKAQLQLAQQVENTATAAGDAAVKQAQASGVTATGTLQNQAMLASLQENAKHLTGPALDAINGYIADLEKTTTSTSVTTDKLANLGLTVDNLPPGHFIKIEAPTADQMKNLSDLKYMTLTLPDGRVIVSANTQPAIDEINSMIADYRSQVINLRATMPALNAGTSQRMGTYAAGGFTGHGGKYTPAGIVHAGEFVFPQEAVNKLGVGFLGSLAGLPGYSSGGYAPAEMMQVGKIAPTVHMDTSGVGSQFAAMIKGAQAALAALAVGSGVERWRGTVDAVLRALGRSTSLDNGILSMIQHESGGNPNAINLTDSNARAGHPSQGLMQTIPSTFYAYAGPYASRGITDPFANVYAGVNYALHDYGASMLAAGGRHARGGAYVGYKTGTNFVPNDGPAYLHRGEAVVPADKNQGSPYQSGPAVFHLYDSDGALLGTMRGVASDAAHGALDSLRQAGAY
jgi:hypothetical protein